jgi:molybdopterin biosynthesis enzyme
VKAIAVRREGAVTPEALVGRVLCHDVRDAAGKVAVAKGARVDEATAQVLLDTPWDEIHVIAPDPGDIHEEEAGRRLAAAVVGDGVEVKGYTGGQWTLVATRRGLLRIRREPLAEVNAREGTAVFTLFDGQPVQAGETVAKAKVTPLVMAGDTVDAIEATGRAAGGIITVKPFLPRVVGVVARESLDARQRARFEDALRLKLDWFGSRLLPIRFAGPSARSVADELRALREEGAEVLVVAGASALDPLDPVFGGLTLLGARMERHGAPAHPGSLLWVARWDSGSVLGMPTCGMFSQATTFDLVLPVILAGETVGNEEIAALGHGGLLSRDMAYRFPPYREGAVRGELA